MTHRAIYIIIICAFLIENTVIGKDSFIYHTNALDKAVKLSVAATHAAAYLLYPLLGWLSDVYFTRYKVVRLAFIIMCVVGTGALVLATASVIDISITTNLKKIITALLLGLPMLLMWVLSLGLFEANAIQLGMDQMLEASSDQLSSFIHWYYWSSSLGQVTIMILTAALVLLHTSCTVPKEHSNLTNFLFPIGTQFALSMVIVQLPFLVIGIFLLICYRTRFNIEKPGYNPLILIYKVLKYAWKHTCPENRSAFTYWEDHIPPRIDLGKEKYGGPFTTEEVEDTKSFFRILFLLFTLLGFHLSGHGYSTVKQLMKLQCPNIWLYLLIADPVNITAIVILIGIPLYQLTNKYCSQKYLPSMLKRMKLGLLCCLLKIVMEISLQATQETYMVQKCSNGYPLINCFLAFTQVNQNGSCVGIQQLHHCSDGTSVFLMLLIIPQILHGLSHLLVFLTALEFISAQAPLRLKGLLIGLWYASLSVHNLMVQAPEIYITESNAWEVFQEVKAFFIALSLILFAYVSRQYRYRVRDEVVNEQFLVEEIYERELIIAAQLETEEEEERRALLGETYSSTS